ncbi:MAG TPA: hypothetical protein VH351_11575 [Bryobacteraceae bacterium]|nr:hypothetical protein [Bryobacteraceae bacterium]
MRKYNLHPAVLLTLLAAVLAVVFWGVHRYRHRLVREPVDLVRLLPLALPLERPDASTLYIDVSALRKSGYLDLLAGANATNEADYHQFVEATNFEYTRDLQAIAGAVWSDRLHLYVQGHFDWSRLREYARRRSGDCSSDECSLPATQPGKWVGFAELQPDVMALVVAPNREAASGAATAALAQTRPTAPSLVSPDPVWFRPAHSMLERPGGFPHSLRMLAISLQPANSVTVSLGPSSLGSSGQAAFDLKLKASFAKPAMADTAKNQLEIDTKMLRLELAREGARANPADLTGLFTAGTFSQQRNVLFGTWPVRKEFLKALR